MKKSLAILILILLSANLVFSDTAIEGSKYICKDVDGGTTLVRLNKNNEEVSTKFKKEIKKVTRKIRQLQNRKKNTKNRTKKRNITKKIRTQKKINKALKACQKTEVQEPAPDLQQVMADCTGNFDLSFNENPAKFTVISNGEVAVMTGVITTRFARKVRNLINNNPNLRTIVLTNLPGSDSDETNVVAARLVHNANLATCVPDNGGINSGGVDLFLAGTTRYLGENPTVGVHSWASNNGTEGADLPRNDRRHNLYLNYYRDIGFDTEFYFYTLDAAPADSIYDMTAEEIAMWGLETK